MRTLRTLSLLLLGGAAALTATARAPQEGFDPAAMEAAMKFAGPGPEHEELVKYAGDWELTAKLSMAPGAPATTETGTATAKAILGGRFLQIDSEGAFMGTPFESMIVLGYDRRHERWTSVGFDTLGTYWVSAQGVQEEDGKIRMHGVDEDPTMGRQVFFNELELKDGELVFSVWFTQLGGWTFDEPFRIVESRYTRD